MLTVLLVLAPWFSFNPSVYMPWAATIGHILMSW
jgi:hypothetical protein